MADAKLSQLTQLAGAMLNTDDVYMQRSGTSYKVPYSIIVSSHTHDIDNINDAGSYVRMTTTERTKLSGIEANATNTSESPIATVVAFAGASAPTGWLICDGSLVSTTTYADLFAVIGYTYGGTGATFQLPDMRGRTTIGVGTGAGLTARSLADTGGTETHQLTEAEMPSHTHTVDVGGGSGGGAPATRTNNDLAGSVGTVNTGSTGGDGAHENMQPYIALNFIIKI